MTIRVMLSDVPEVREAVFKSKKPRKGLKNAQKAAPKPKKAKNS